MYITTARDRTQPDKTIVNEGVWVFGIYLDDAGSFEKYFVITSIEELQAIIDKARASGVQS